jgi:hypothetical protein
MAPWIAGTSTILTSETFHCAPTAAAPAVVMRSTTCVGGIPGGMIGAGRGGGACAIENVEIIIGTAADTTHATSLPKYFMCISFLPCSIDHRVSIDSGGEPVQQQIWPPA